jgi:hypothetical protein
MRLSLAISALLAVQPLAFTEVSAAPPSDKPQGKAEGDKDKAEQKICRLETPTGSIRPIRTCKTRAEFEAEANRAQANKNQLDTDRMRQQMLSGSRG